MPSGPGVRVDDWVEDGTAIAGDYDPLLGKLLVVEADRPSAIARMARALDEVEVTGLQTTLPFHRWLMADDGFRAGDLSTELVDQRWRPAAEREAAAGRAATVAAAAFARDAAGTAGTPPAGAASARSDAARSVVRGPDGIGPHSTDSDALGTDATGNRDLAGWLRVGRREGVERWPR
jgi:acetyl/propionyl-CoA carboxylase alpha subunit